MSHQDFEKYAEEKPFNYSVPEKFKDSFNECVNSLGISLPSIKILDFGCGNGKHYQFFIQSGMSPANVYGVEVSKKRIEKCHEIGWENAFFIEGETLNFSDNEFDIINMAEVIEHIPAKRVDAIFSELTRVIRKKGCLIVTTPNYPIKRFYDINDSYGHRSLKRLKDDPTHVTFYSVKKLNKFLGNYFDQVKIVPYKRGFLYEKYKKDFFLHKMLAICSNKK